MSDSAKTIQFQQLVSIILLLVDLNHVGAQDTLKEKKDIVGENFGDWTVIKVLPNEKSIMSMCLWCRKGIGKEEQTEDEIMKSYNYLKIYDCGNMKFIWNKA